MPKIKGVDPGDRHDHRVTVLVLIGLCICLPHLYRALAPSSSHRPSTGQGRQRLIWLERPSSREDGLYGLEDLSWDWPRIFAALDLPIPAGALPPLGDTILPAYRLSPTDPPQIIPFPARAAPIFFQPIPINRATAETLMTIPGVGRSMATAIIDHRRRTGKITDRASLLTIEGIGEKKAAIIERYICYE
jgi:hypothetical protein